MSEERDEARAHEIAAELRVLIGRLRRKLRDQANPGDLTWPQVAVIRHLKDDVPMTVTALARAEGVRPQSMGATVATLEEAGFLQSAPDPSDGRQKIYSLTPRCRDWIGKARAAREDWLFRAIRAHLSEKEEGELQRGVELLKRLLDG